MVVNDHNNPGVGKTQRRRLFLVLACAGLWIGLLIGRLGQLQIAMHDELVELARVRHQLVAALPATRGDIYAADGSLLASSIQGRAIYVYPHLLDDPESVAAALAPALQMPVEEVFPLLTKECGCLVYLRKFAPPEMVEKVLEVRRRFNLYTSLGTHEASARFYPNRQLAAHVLGFVDSEGNGASGVEYSLDKAIRGQDGQWITLKDGGQTPIDPDGIFREDPVPGHDIFLTIDPAIQRVAEATLERAVHEHDAEGASAVVMDPRTGEVLALASYPTFNPNVRDEALVKLSSANSVVNHAYEPGSTFKIFTAAAGLTEHVVYEDELIDCQGGALRVANHTYHDWRSGFGVMPFSQVIANSSNVGTIKVGLRISPEHFYRWLQGFGFGQTTGIELPGEAPGIVHEPGSSLWSGLSQSSMIIGQEIGVTPLQLATAVSAIANGGLLMKPYLVSQIRDADGTLQMQRRPEVRRRVLDESIARRVLNVLEGVVRPDNNTGKAAGIRGYRIAGKTGTAQKIGPNGTYSQYMSSFVGILPASAPELVVLVVIDAPRKGYYGTEVAAPAFRTIAETAVRVLRIAPDAVAAPVQINGS